MGFSKDVDVLVVDGGPQDFWRQKPLHPPGSLPWYWSGSRR